MVRDHIYREEIATVLIDELVSFYGKYPEDFQDQMTEIVKDVKGTPKFNDDIFREVWGVKFLIYYLKRPCCLNEGVRHITVLTKGLRFFHGDDWENELRKILERVKDRRGI